MTSVMHIYAFGSICRGEILPGSDIDLLAVVTGNVAGLSTSMFSIYSHAKMRQIWSQGNPFAWHLHLESKLLHSSDDRCFMDELGCPSPYVNAEQDCRRFIAIFREAADSARSDHNSIVFDLSAIFLGLRNFCSCYLLGQGRPNFSRGVALSLMGDNPPVSIETYRTVERARLICTRGYGVEPNHTEIEQTLKELPELEKWMLSLLEGGPNAR